MIPPPPKPLFTSKTALAGLLTATAGAIGGAYPEFGQFLASHANPILIGLGLLSIALRMVTKGRVVLFPD